MEKLENYKTLNNKVRVYYPAGMNMTHKRIDMFQGIVDSLEARFYQKIFAIFVNRNEKNKEDLWQIGFRFMDKSKEMRK